MAITNGSVSDIAVVTCVDPSSANERSAMRRIAVDRASSPYETREIPTIGLQQGHLAEILLDDVRMDRNAAPLRPVLSGIGESSTRCSTVVMRQRP